MKLEAIQVGMIGTNCYLLYDDTQSNAAAIIDPGGDSEHILRVIREKKLDVKMILLTHGHFDHVLGVPGILSAYPGLPVYITETDYPEARDGGSFGYAMGAVDSVHYYDEGSVVELGSLQIKVMRTPGHTPGSVTLQVEDVLFTGDTLFCCSCGRTDFPGGSFAQMQASLKRLADLPGDYRVYPGHESFTTLERERQSNPFITHI